MLCINPQSGITFASGLRTILRQDPNVIMVGEIRDVETAEIAIHAALTGHLVLASIHGNDVSHMILRLIEMGIEPHLLASTAVGMVAQRMIRRICPNCRSPLPLSELSEEEITAYREEIGEEPPVLYYGKGCSLCNYIGYSGRVGIFEVLYMNDINKNELFNISDASGIREAARRQGVKSMRHEGMIKVQEGISTISEVLNCIFTGN